MQLIFIPHFLGICFLMFRLAFTFAVDLNQTPCSHGHACYYRNPFCSRSCITNYFP